MHEFRFLIRDSWPYEVRRAIRKAADNDEAMSEASVRCAHLFRAIICRAIADAYGKTGLEDPSERRTCIREAREFFWQRGEWFEFIFQCAGVDPAPIVPHMLKLSPLEFPRLVKKPVDSGGTRDRVAVPKEPKE